MIALVFGVLLPLLLAQDPPAPPPAPNPVAPPAAAAAAEDEAAEPRLERRTYKVGEVERTALVYMPAEAGEQPVPLVFVFHGHGGTMRNAARTFRMHEHWPEALVVYPQGLNTPGQLTDPEGKRPGWQKEPGDQADRDLAFFDAMLAELKEGHRIDARRIHATGHSNGGGFTYLLWATRGEVFASFAPSAAAANKTLREATLVPRPLFHLAGRKDELVKFNWQVLTVAAIVKAQQCADAEPWKQHEGCTIRKSKSGAHVVTYVHDGGHRFVAETGALIAEFFRDTPRPEPTTADKPGKDAQPTAPVTPGK